MPRVKVEEVKTKKVRATVKKTEDAKKIVKTEKGKAKETKTIAKETPKSSIKDKILESLNIKKAEVKEEKPKTTKAKKAAEVKEEKPKATKAKKAAEVKKEKPKATRTKKAAEVKEEKPKATKAKKVAEVKEEKPKATKAKKAAEVKEEKPKATRTKKAAEVKEEKPKATKAKKAAEVKEEKPKATKAKKVVEVKEEKPKTTKVKKVVEVKEEKPKATKAKKVVEIKEEKAKTTKTKKTTTTKKVSAKKTTKKTTAKKTTAKKTIAKKTTTKKVKTYLPEYYDLPYRYNDTIVRILYQTPKRIFVYWDISDSDRQRYINAFGEDFFDKTYPVLLVHNEDMNYTFEVRIDDFANSWYIDINDPKNNYVVQLGRKFKQIPLQQINYEKVKEEEINLQNDYIYITHSNKLETPNDKVLFASVPEKIKFRNVKTGEVTYKETKQVLRKVSRIYDNPKVEDLYRELYGEEILLEDASIIGNPSSGNSSSFFK